jgi:hypothetical protein
MLIKLKTVAIVGAVIGLVITLMLRGPPTDEQMENIEKVFRCQSMSKPHLPPNHPKFTP